MLGTSLQHRTEGAIAAPGTKASHYAPNAQVEVVCAADVHARVAALEDRGVRAVALDAPRDPAEYAHVLYAHLRTAAARDVDVIVAPAPRDDGSFGTAVLDRLRRASNR